DEMAIIRLTHVADLPSPEELVRKLQNTPQPPAPTPGGGTPSGGGGGGSPMALASSPRPSTAPGGSSSGTVTALAVANEQALARYATFDHVVELIRKKRDVKLLVEVETCLRLGSYQPGRIEFVPTPNAPPDLAQRLGQRLQGWTGNRWAVTLVNEGGGDTIAEIRDAAENALRSDAMDHPMVQAVLMAFPKAKITEIKTQQDIAAEAQAEALPEVEGEWDPFEED
ncbi:MAG: DNA polymerase III subunit gamma/tau, partial [Tateyamaria sp.]